MYGTLYICGTPIGNLKDITIRCLETLQNVDVVVAEDTRHTLKLLNHYEIKKPLESYHEHNKDTKGIKIIKLLKEGKNIALVSDAGMPGISDPGEDLIKLCYENEVKVTVVPGATAVISALVISGLKIRSYCFEGFLPNNKKQRKEVLSRLKNENRTIVLYEAPHNLKSTLAELLKEIGNRKVSVVREITKKYEFVHRGSLEDILTYFNQNIPKGEIVVVLEGSNIDKSNNELENPFLALSIEEHFEQYIKLGHDSKSSMKLVAKERGISKREIYKYVKIK